MKIEKAGVRAGLFVFSVTGWRGPTSYILAGVAVHSGIGVAAASATVGLTPV